MQVITYICSGNIYRLKYNRYIRNTGCFIDQSLLSVSIPMSNLRSVTLISVLSYSIAPIDLR